MPDLPPKTIETSDRLIDSAPRRQERAGRCWLRIVMAQRAGFAQRLGKSGLIQTGDVLTFRSEAGGPLSQRADGYQPHRRRLIGWRAAQHRQSTDQEYLGPRQSGASSAARTIAPRSSSRHPTAQSHRRRARQPRRRRACLTSASRVYPKVSSQDYNAPKFESGGSYDFVSSWARSGWARTRRATASCSDRSSPGRCWRSGIATRPSPPMPSRGPASRRASSRSWSP